MVEDDDAWEVDVGDDAFYGVDDRHAGLLVVDFAERRVRGDLVDRGVVRDEPRCWMFDVGRVSGKDLARWARDWLDELEAERASVLRSPYPDWTHLHSRLHDRMVADLADAKGARVRVVRTPAEALEQLAMEIGADGVRAEACEKGVGVLSDVVGTELDGDEEEQVDAILWWVREQLQAEAVVAEVAPIDARFVEVWALLGEPHVGWEVVVDDDASADALRDLVERWGLHGPGMRADETEGYWWFLPVTP